MILSNTNVTYKSFAFDSLQREMKKEAEEVISYVETNIDRYRAHNGQRVVGGPGSAEFGISTMAKVKIDPQTSGPGLENVNSLWVDQDDGALDRTITFQRTELGQEIFERYDWEGEHIKVTRDPRSGSLFIEH